MWQFFNRHFGTKSLYLNFHENRWEPFCYLITVGSHHLSGPSILPKSKSGEDLFYFLSPFTLRASLSAATRQGRRAGSPPMLRYLPAIASRSGEAGGLRARSSLTTLPLSAPLCAACSIWLLRLRSFSVPYGSLQLVPYSGYAFIRISKNRKTTLNYCIYIYN